MSLPGSFLHPRRERQSPQVVLFSGGRGSGALAKQLVTSPGISLTVAVNGYDDGASTGEVRRFLGDALGPSDFRKNASRIARERRSCRDPLIDLLDHRLPAPCSREDALRALQTVGGTGSEDPAAKAVAALVHGIDEPSRLAVAARLEAFERELGASGKPFDFSDCSVGNLVFAGAFLTAGRRFNEGLDDYCGLLGLPPGLIDNVTDGTNAFLVAIDLDGRVLGSEEEIVDATRRNRIRDIYLIDRSLTSDERFGLGGASPDAVAKFLKTRTRPVTVNPRLVERIAAADLIVYAPGTQHSSLFPSYLTPGLSSAIARNLGAIKLLITNIQSDAEIADSSAVDIIERAVYYLKERNRLSTPTPCLITHYLINDPGTIEPDRPYVPLGRVEALEDPRLVRIANYEDGVSGRHDAAKILGPFLATFVSRQHVQKVAIRLHDAGSLNKLSQTVLEMIRGGIEEVPVSVTIFYDRVLSLDPGFKASLPFAIRELPSDAAAAKVEFRRALQDDWFDYAVLFESSGMYRGEDITSLTAPLASGRLDAVWGSRRLSVKDIEASYRLRYRHNALLGAVSYVGSHALSLAYLVLYGRYISDTLSGVRAVRASYLRDAGIDPMHKLANQQLLSALLRDKADLLETPVQFLPLSPEMVRRTSVLEGLASLGTIVWRRFARRPTAPGAHVSPAPTAHPTESESHPHAETL